MITSSPENKTSFADKLSAFFTNAPKAAFPEFIQPMLATLVDKPFDEPGWQYEIKWDGYRAMAYLNMGDVNILSRNNKSFNEKFYAVFNALKEWKMNLVIDGEIVVLNDNGIANFGALQNWRSEADGELIYYVFDVLWMDGHNLMPLPLYIRREILKILIPSTGIIRISENFQTNAIDFLATIDKLGMEGIMAKKIDSSYLPGTRNMEWIKVKAHKRHEVIIGGFTQNEGSSKPFSSLLVGLYDNGRLNYTGKIGTGFSNKLQLEIMEKMVPLIISEAPFKEIPDVDKPSRFRPNPPKAKVNWLKPVLVCEVSYAEMTKDGVMRHPSFEGMRIDKAAADVIKEQELPTMEVIKKVKKSTEKNIIKVPEYVQPVIGKSRKSLLNPKDESQVREVNGQTLKFSHLSKIYWPKENFTKRDMLNYYYRITPYILPYLKDRPQSLNRFPNGIEGKSFYQKDLTGKAPDWIKMFPYHTSDGEDKNFMVPQDEASILYMANLGTIEMNPWNSTIYHPENPDWCMIDLDPGDTTSFEQVIKTAQVTKQVLDDVSVVSYPKTSGSTGIHIYIPLGAKYSYDQCQLFAKIIATKVQAELPDFTSIERLTKNREGKMYIDYLQNRPKATLAAPYSLRPKPGATVSMPLHWDEIKQGLQMKDYTIVNALDRIKQEGDIFKAVLGKGIDLNKVLKKL